MALTISSPIGDLVLDAALAHTLQADADVTDHPVEKGSAVTDHYRPKPRQVQVDGIVTDTPVSLAERRALAGSKVKARTRAVDAIALLTRIRDEGQLCTISDSRYLYQNMLLFTLSVPRDPSTGEAARFSAAFREIVVVQTSTVQLAKVQRVNAKTGLVKINASKTDDATTHKSILKKGADSGPGDALLKALGLRK
jgi:hypothetical protein